MSARACNNETLSSPQGGGPSTLSRQASWSGCDVRAQRPAANHALPGGRAPWPPADGERAQRAAALGGGGLLLRDAGGLDEELVGHVAVVVLAQQRREPLQALAQRRAGEKTTWGRACDEDAAPGCAARTCTAPTATPPNMETASVMSGTRGASTATARRGAARVNPGAASHGTSQRQQSRAPSRRIAKPPGVSSSSSSRSPAPLCRVARRSAQQPRQNEGGSVRSRPRGRQAATHREAHEGRGARRGAAQKRRHAACSTNLSLCTVEKGCGSYGRQSAASARTKQEEAAARVPQTGGRAAAWTAVVFGRALAHSCTVS